MNIFAKVIMITGIVCSIIILGVDKYYEMPLIPQDSYETIVEDENLVVGE